MLGTPALRSPRSGLKSGASAPRSPGSALKLGASALCSPGSALKLGASALRSPGSALKLGAPALRRRAHFGTAPEKVGVLALRELGPRSSGPLEGRECSRTVVRLRRSARRWFSQHENHHLSAIYCSGVVPECALRRQRAALWFDANRAVCLDRPHEQGNSSPCTRGWPIFSSTDKLRLT
jgi:hypothetical protein